MEFDYVIVGAGTAGCALANRLTENGKHQVLLLEAGKHDLYHWIHIPVGYLYCIDNPRTDWRFRTQAQPKLNGRSLIYPRGKVLGGCSSINGMLYLRGQAADYDHWAELGNHGWSWQDVLPYFKKSEDYHAGADEFHGQGGPWRVDKQRLRWDVLEDFQAGCVEQGIPASTDFNRGDNFGVGYFEVNQRKGWRWNTAKAFLRPAKNRPNLTVLTQAQALKLTFEGQRVSGVEISHKGQRKTVSARAETILTSGAIGSPALLQHSGIGPAEHLQSLGIEVKHDAPDVGHNLQDHLQIRCAYKLKNAKTLNTMANSLIGQMMIGLEYMLKRTGPMSMAPSQLGAFAYSDDNVERPDLEYHVQPLSLEAFGQPLHEFPAMTASVCHLRPESRGTVLIQSADSTDAPAIDPNYLATEGDRQVAANAIRLTRRLMGSAAMQKYSPIEFKPGDEFQSDEELAIAAGQIASTIFHPVGTARMGSDDRSVVDPTLKVRGVQGLRVVDASVMPLITSGNTNSPTLMIAEKAADMFLAGS